MGKTATSILINDDEVEFKRINVFSFKSKKIKRYTLDRAEKQGLIKVAAGPIKMGGEIYSKSITLNGNKLKLSLSTRRNGK